MAYDLTILEEGCKELGIRKNSLQIFMNIL